MKGALAFWLALRKLLGAQERTARDEDAFKDYFMPIRAPGTFLPSPLPDRSDALA